MGTRLDLHEELLKFLPNTYFQPPTGLQMTYPCIVYSKTGKSKSLANDGVYLNTQGYKLMIIERNPDSSVADEIESNFQHCIIEQYYTVSNLYHTTLNLYY